VKLSVVVPAFNEETTVGGVLRAHVDAGRRIAGEVEVIVCDDGSTDGTPGAIANVAADLPEVRILRNVPNAGIPATMKRLYSEARGDWVFFTPADGQVPVTALETMWNAREGQALVIGGRVPRKARSRVCSSPSSTRRGCASSFAYRCATSTASSCIAVRIFVR